MVQAVGIEGTLIANDFNDFGTACSPSCPRSG
jgi:hypothetical protein